MTTYLITEEQRLEAMDTALDKLLVAENVSLRAEVGQLRAQLAAENVRSGYAGVTVWCGKHKVTRVLSELQMMLDSEYGRSLVEASQESLNAIATAQQGDQA